MPALLVLLAAALALATGCPMPGGGAGSPPTTSTTSTTLPPAAWPKFHHDRPQTGQSQFGIGGNSGVVKWKFPTTGGVSSSPAIGGDGAIYVGSDDHSLYALNPDGSLRWGSSTGGAVFSSPAIGPDGTIYVGSGDDSLYAFYPNGSVRWQVPTGHAVNSSPAVGVDGTVYVGSQDGSLYAVTPAGATLWQFSPASLSGTPASIESSPAIAGDGTIYVGSMDHNLYAVNPDGTQKWKRKLDEAVESSPAIGSDGTIYVGANLSSLYAVTPTGPIKWQLTLGAAVVSSPAIGTDGTIYVGSNNGNVYAVTPLGVEKWHYSTGAAIRHSSPAVGADGTIYVGSSDQGLYALDASGNLKWKVTTGGSVFSSPAIGADGTVYVGSGDQSVYAIGGTPCTASPGSCCGPERMTLVSTAGTLRVSNLVPWPFPAGVITTIDSGPAAGAAGECRHATVVPAGGFVVPHFDIPALNYCMDVVDRHCESGPGEGAGSLWDGHGTPGLAITSVSTRGDTSAGACGPLGSGCTTMPGGAGADTLGDIDRTTSASGGCGLRAESDVPVRIRVWSDGVCAPATSPGCCATSSYGDDTIANGELLIAQLDTTLGLTTNQADAAFADKNGDHCARAGAGFYVPGADGPKVLTGAPAAGPCCTAGQPTTLVAGGVSFGGGAPLFDLGYQITMPTTVKSCGTPGSDTCTVTTNACFR